MGKAPATSNQEDSEDWNSLEKHLRPPERKKLLAIYFIVIVALATLGFCFYLWDSWNRQLVFAPIAPEQIACTGYAWATPGTATVPSITITIRNAGLADLSIVEWRVDGDAATANPAPPQALTKGSSMTFTITSAGNFTRGIQYNFMVVTSMGNQFGPYSLTAP
ncbi:MAG: hypothetical protein QXM22_02940 [Candidatus Bathyarchaeia archaeon]